MSFSIEGVVFGENVNEFSEIVTSKAHAFSRTNNAFNHVNTMKNLYHKCIEFFEIGNSEFFAMSSAILDLPF